MYIRYAREGDDVRFSISQNSLYYAELTKILTL